MYCTRFFFQSVIFKGVLHFERIRCRFFSLKSHPVTNIRTLLIISFYGIPVRRRGRPRIARSPSPPPGLRRRRRERTRHTQSPSSHNTPFRTIKRENSAASRRPGSLTGNFRSNRSARARLHTLPSCRRSSSNPAAVRPRVRFQSATAAGSFPCQRQRVRAFARVSTVGAYFIRVARIMSASSRV